MYFRTLFAINKGSEHNQQAGIRKEYRMPARLLRSSCYLFAAIWFPSGSRRNTDASREL